jgi:hypothetical protein
MNTLKKSNTHRDDRSVFPDEYIPPLIEEEGVVETLALGCLLAGGECSEGDREAS